jgi:hypothetical protein
LPYLLWCGLDTDQIEDLLERIARVVHSEAFDVTQTFIEPHPEGKTSDSEHTGWNESPYATFSAGVGW